MIWKCFPRYWPFVRKIHRLPVDFPPQRASNVGLWWFLCCEREGTVEQIIQLSVIWDNMMILRRNCDEMSPCFSRLFLPSRAERLLTSYSPVKVPHCCFVQEIYTRFWLCCWVLLWLVPVDLHISFMVTWLASTHSYKCPKQITTKSRWLAWYTRTFQIGSKEITCMIPTHKSGTIFQRLI